MKTLCLTGFSVVALAGVAPGCIAFDPPIPTETQLRWMDWEVGAMSTYSMQTYDQKMSPGNVIPASSFKPVQTRFTDTWLDAAVAFGAKYFVSVMDHFSGFVGWPTNVTGYEYGVQQATQWQGGNGDMVRDFIASSKAAGVAPGVFYSLHNNWYMDVSGFHTKDPSKQKAYNAIVMQQVRELLDPAGPYGAAWQEVWFDAGIGGMFNDTAPVGPLIDELQPNSMLHSSSPYAAKNGVRWVGNENADTPMPNWLSVDSGAECGQATSGSAQGTVFCPPSCDTVLREHFWFWKPDTEDTIKSTQELISEYVSSVGRGCTLILNINPDPTGTVPAVDMAAYTAFGAAVQLLFGPKAELQRWEKPSLSPQGWAAGLPGMQLNLTGAGSGSLVNGSIVLMEDLGTFGQRIAEVNVSVLTGGQWSSWARTSTIAHKRILMMPEAMGKADVSAVRVSVQSIEGVSAPGHLRSVALLSHSSKEALDVLP